jgi:DeoR/GlpR family transcriptional regulator of sugar metabolism
VTLAAVRRSQILAEVRQVREVNVTDLSQRFGVSNMTVRRDLEALSSAGKLTRVHGGAICAELPTAAEPTGGRPSPTAADLALASRAARLIRPGWTIALTPGTVGYALARRVAAMPAVNVVTNSLWVAQLLHEHHRETTTLLTGGLGSRSGGLVGGFVAATLRGTRVDALFMEVDCIDARAGLTTSQFGDAAAGAAFIEAADTVVVVAPSMRWGKVGLCPIASLDVVDTLVTDRVTARMRAEIGRRIRRIVADGTEHVTRVTTQEPRPAAGH